MHRQPRVAPVTGEFLSATTVACPLQVLVVDDVNGPASILVATVSLLVERDVSVITVDDPGDVLRALNYYQFDLIVVGLQPERPFHMAILPHIAVAATGSPIVAVGRQLPQPYRQWACQSGADTVIELPERATELKTLVANMSTRYLQPA